jgi:hypothetical protein
MRKYLTTIPLCFVWSVPDIGRYILGCGFILPYIIFAISQLCMACALGIVLGQWSAHRDISEEDLYCAIDHLPKP